jgi:7-cyano-7-deazaguanine synthase
MKKSTPTRTKRHGLRNVKTPSVVIFSGGPDSTAAAIWAMKHNFAPELLTFQFSEQQEGELNAAHEVARELNLPLHILDFRSWIGTYGGRVHILMHGALRDTEIPNEDRFLPFASVIVLTIASSWAAHRGIRTVIWGATKDDGSMREEYSQAFSTKLARFLSASSKYKIKILAPLSRLHKFEVLKVYRERPDLFAKTWSSSSGGRVQKGVDPASIARRVAAIMAGVEDRTEYAVKEFKNPVPDDVLRGVRGMSAKSWAPILASNDCSHPTVCGFPPIRNAKR